MHMVSRTKSTSNLGYMNFTIVVSLKMSGEPVLSILKYGYFHTTYITNVNYTIVKSHDYNL